MKWGGERGEGTMVALMLLAMRASNNGSIVCEYCIA